MDDTSDILAQWPNSREFSGGQLAVRTLCREAKLAARMLATLTPSALDALLEEIARALENDAAAILAANALDLAAAELGGLSTAQIDRLRLSEKSLDHIVASVRQVARLPQPLGAVIKAWTQPNGLLISKVRVPIGVVAIIYESRPNVTIDAAVLCLKTGNATLLRGGKEALHSNRALLVALQRAPSLPAGAIQLVGDPDRGLIPFLCEQSETIDLIIPRGGAELIETVTRHARIPVIKHAAGLCTVFVEASADLAMAEAIVLNAKTQRPGVCNAIETLLIDAAVAEAFVPQIVAALVERGVEIRGDATVLRLADSCGVVAADEADWSTEFLDLILAVKVVAGLPGALAHLATYGSHHSDAIVTEDTALAEAYLNQVDSATVYWNASTRFTDGGEFGFGAEIGISTDKLHARGPMGLEELTTYKYLIRGTGQVRL